MGSHYLARMLPRLWIVRTDIAEVSAAFLAQYPLSACRRIRACLQWICLQVIRIEVVVSGFMAADRSMGDICRLRCQDSRCNTSHTSPLLHGTDTAMSIIPLQTATPISTHLPNTPPAPTHHHMAQVQLSSLPRTTTRRQVRTHLTEVLAYSMVEHSTLGFHLVTEFTRSSDRLARFRPCLMRPTRRCLRSTVSPRAHAQHPQSPHEHERNAPHCHISLAFSSSRGIFLAFCLSTSNRTNRV